MSDKPSRLLRCPLPESWEKTSAYSYKLGSDITQAQAMAIDQCVEDLRDWLSRIEPLLVALMESGDAMRNSEVEADIAWDAAKKAFLEGVGDK